MVVLIEDLLGVIEDASPEGGGFQDLDCPSKSQDAVPCRPEGGEGQF